MMDSLETNGTTAIEQTSQQPIVAETAPIEETAASTTVSTPQNKQEVLARAKEIVASENPIDKQEVEALKQGFYKFHNAEVAQARQKFVDEGGNSEEFVPELDTAEPEFRALMQIIRDRRAKELEEIEKQKQEGLARKLEILDRIQQMATTPEDANQHFDEFKQLQAEWKEIKSVPAERATELWKNYQLYTEQFYDLLKLGHELREYDFRKNQEVKTRLCEQAEALQNEEDVVAAINQLQGLHQEWKETGPVAKEIREELWNRFKEASTIIRKKHQAHFEARKAEEENNLAQKEALCVEIENITLDELKTFAQWDEMTKKIIELQTQWRTIGYAPQKMNTAIFERFRKACDRFFEQKSNFYHDLKESFSQNLAKKKALVEKAEALTNSTEWRSTADTMIQMQKEWKEIGNIPRKAAESLWNRFITACDHFFEEKQKAEAEAQGEQNANLEKKKSIIEALTGLEENKDAKDIIAKVKELQKEWNATGHVPFREKDKLYQEYRAIVDKLFQAYNNSQTRRRLNNFKNALANKAEAQGVSLTVERTRMMRAYENLRTEIQTYENNLGFLSISSKKGNSLVDTMKKRVDRLHNELALLAEKIRAVDEQLKKGEAE
ncbi:MAG: DUF349 domain-containing protein [Bacteroidaceae bacterium]|nr:DUF349 domain-containing protein [Bacteroidaceae bacterium]